MTKEKYLKELSDLLKERGVADIDEIIAEYEEHFTRKMADGYTQEEIAAKLGSPKEIAFQFAAGTAGADRKNAGRLVVGTGLVFADIFVVSFFILLYAWVFVLAVSAVAPAVLGLGFFIRPLLPVNLIFMPPMPYIGGVIMGISLLSFGVLMGVLALYCWTLAAQLVRAYRRWHKNTLSGGKYPPLSKHPLLGDVTRRRMRSVSLIALVVLGVSLIIGYIVLAAAAGGLGFWHVWGWFV